MPKKTQIKSRSSKSAIGPRQNLVTSFGLLWDAQRVDWKAKRLLGHQKGKRKGPRANFWTQSGVYALFDGDKLQYIGIATKLGPRISRHRTSDRRAEHWDRFSWFGTNELSQTTSLGELLPTATFERDGRAVRSGRQDAKVRVWRLWSDIEALLDRVFEAPGQGRHPYFGGPAPEWEQVKPDSSGGEN